MSTNDKKKEAKQYHYFDNYHRGKDLTIIRCGEVVIWKEPAFYEGWPRFNQVKEILKAKYGAKFKSLKPTERSQLALYGDDLKVPEKISFT